MVKGKAVGEAMGELSTATASADDRELLNKAQEILDLFKTADRLGWTLVLPPEKYRILINILESGDLMKVKGKSND
jgi:hypothetical protein